MNADFHYYATYLAARHASFSHDEALTIAPAAGFVDDLTAQSKPKGAPPRVTCMAMADMTPHFFDSTMTPAYERELRDIWLPFHFIPGNENNAVAYQGPREEYLPPWKWSAEEERNFTMLCLPNSAYAVRMINDTAQYSSRPNFLHMLGLRMHVLADSWAHQNFLGLPAMYANDLYDKSHTKNRIEMLVGGAWKQIQVSPMDAGVFRDDLARLVFFCTPTTPQTKTSPCSAIHALAACRTMGQ